MLLTAAAFAVACGGKAAPEEPAPEPTPTAAPTPPPEPVDDSAERERLEKERMEREAAERARTVSADLSAMINFDYDQAVVRPADQQTLDRKAAILAANPQRQASDRRPCRRARIRRVQPCAGQPSRRRRQAVSGEQGRGRVPPRSRVLR